MYILVLLSLAALLALAGLFQFWGSWRDDRRFPPPGRLIDIDGRKLHARVTGSGAPSAIFEAGISASSVNWTPLHAKIDRLTTTCSYDRAGLGWSDAPLSQFNAQSMVADLAALLEKLKLPRPFVLVGHSYGGLLVRLYAEQYPQNVGGLVLVDPILECQWARPNPHDERVRRAARNLTRWGAILARFGLVRLATSQAVIGSGMLPRIAAKNGTVNGMLYRLTTEMGKLPEEIIPVFRAQWCRAKNFRAMADHLDAMPQSFELLRRARLDIPAIVISAANLGANELAEHRAIAALFTQGEHRIAENSGHWIHFDRPELIEQAIVRIVGQVRRPSHNPVP